MIKTLILFIFCDGKKRTFLASALKQMNKFYDSAVESNSEYVTGEIRMDKVTHSDGIANNEPCTWSVLTVQYAPLYTRLK